MLSLTVGKELEGRYVVEGLLGSGGYGSVWRAADKQLGRTVALKRLLRTGTAFGPTDLQRLLAEARKHAQLVHTNIVQVYDVIECDGEQLIVMEFVDGPSLLELLRQQVLAGTILPLDRAIAVLRDILSGLSFAHDKQIVHRDLSPANILTTSTGICKIADFGIARVLSEQGHTVGDSAHGGTGNPNFMSPEQQRGDPADKSSDLFMIGIIGYLLLTSTHPYCHSSGLFTIPELLKDEKYSPQLPRPPATLTSSHQRLFKEYAAIVMRLLNRERSGRYSGARDAIVALDAVSPFQECPQCGERIPEHFRFCGFCGASTGGAPGEEASPIPAAPQVGQTADDIVEAGLLLSRRRHWKEAIAKYRQALQLDSRNQKAYRNLAFALNRLHLFEEAQAMLDKGLELGAGLPAYEASLLQERALARSELKDYDRALNDIRRALELVPGSVRSRYLLARIQVYRGAVAEARRDALEVLRIVPDHAGALRLLDQIQ